MDTYQEPDNSLMDYGDEVSRQASREPATRKKDIPRLPPGTRVRMTPCRWWHQTGHGYVEDPDTEDWGTPVDGTVAAPETHTGWHRGPDHIWGLRDWETMVLFDKPRRGYVEGNRPEPIPTAMLDIIQDENEETTIPGQDQETGQGHPPTAGADGLGDVVAG